MNIGLVVNARGKMCLVHDESFEAVPLVVGYHMDIRQIEIFFDTGATYPIDWEATPEMDSYLQKINKILIIRMEDKVPVEGYDTSLFHLKNGEPIESEDGSEQTSDVSARNVESDGQDGEAEPWAAGELISTGTILVTEFESEIVRAELPILLYFWADWCGPCKRIRFVIDELSVELQQQIRVVRVNADEDRDIAAKYGIRSLPTFLLLRDGEVIATKIGALPKAALQSWLMESL